MHIKIIQCLVLFIFSSNALHAAQPSRFIAGKAETYLHSYNQLYPYLQEHVDKPLFANTTPFTWKDAKITCGEESAFTWIESKANQGNIVCLYFFVLNYLKYCHPEQTPRQTQECFTMMMLLLMRITYDIINHYAANQDASIFNAYYIMKQKMSLLLNFVSNEKKAAYPKLKDTIFKALEYWRTNFTIYQPFFSCTWLTSFRWTFYSLNPYSAAIFFGSEISQCTSYQCAINTLEARQLASPKLFPMVSEIFSEIAEDNSWDKFFASFYFPLNQDELKNRIGNPQKRFTH